MSRNWSDDRITDTAAKAVITGRFGTKAVAYDASDPEANKPAVAKGYAVIHGGQFSNGEWAAARRAGMLPPAGKVTRSPKVFSSDPDAKLLKTIAQEDWSDQERRRIEMVKRVAQRLL